MSDVFISYATADREYARLLAKALERQGRTVWWDRTILPGSNWQAVIESALESASCAVVLWSRNSVQSDWVQTEAEEARQRGILVPACLDDVRIPLQFRRIQAASLVGWDGRPSHEGFRTLVQGISAVQGRGAAPKAAASVKNVVEAAATTDKADVPARAVAVTRERRFRTPKWPRLPTWTRSRDWRRVLTGVGVVVVFAVLVKMAITARPLRLTLLTQFPTPKIPVSLSFSPDAKYLGTLDSDQACAWNLETGKKIQCYGSGYAMSWLDGTLLWLKSIGGDKVFDVFAGDNTTVLTGFSGMEISTDKKRISFDTSTGGGWFLDLPETNRTVKVWDIAARKEICTLAAGRSIREAENGWSPDGKYLATTVSAHRSAGLVQPLTLTPPAFDLGNDLSSSAEKTETMTTKIWNTQTCDLVRTFPRFRQGFFFTDRLDWGNLRLAPLTSDRLTSPDGQYYMRSGRIYRASDSSIMPDFRGQFLWWGPKPDEFYVRSADNVICERSVLKAAPVAQLTLPFGIKGSIKISRDRKTIAIPVYDPDSSVYVWNAETRKLFPRIKGVGGSIRLERDGSIMVSQGGAAVAGTITLYDVATSRELARMQGPNPEFSSDGEYMAGVLQTPTGSAQAETSIWRISRRWW